MAGLKDVCILISPLLLLPSSALHAAPLNLLEDASVYAAVEINGTGQACPGNGLCTDLESGTGPKAEASIQDVEQRVEKDSQGRITRIYYGSVAAEADLSLRQVGIEAGTYLSSSTHARADVSDFVAFDLTGLDSLQAVFIPYLFSFHGLYGPNSSDFVNSGVTASFALLDYSNRQWGTPEFGPNPSGAPGVIDLATGMVSTQVGWANFGVGQHSAGDPPLFIRNNLGSSDVSYTHDTIHFAGTIGLQPGYKYALGYLMSLDGVGSVLFGNTASFNLYTDLPYTSQSGVFLTTQSAGNVVPIPSALLLLASGLGPMGYLSWRAKRRAAKA